MTSSINRKLPFPINLSHCSFITSPKINSCYKIPWTSSKIGSPGTRENTHHDKYLVAFMEWSFTTEWLMYNFSLIKWKHQNCNFNLENLWKLLKLWIKIKRWHCKKNTDFGNKTLNKFSLIICTESSVEEYQQFWECLMFLENLSTTMNRFGIELS